MTLDIKDLINMKKHSNNLGINSYEWFFNNLENNWVSKLNGTERNREILKDYDEDAKHFILTQLYYINKKATIDLMEKMELKKVKYLPDYFDEIDKNL